MDNNCELCEHKKIPTPDGHCYMFKEEPQFQCMQNTLLKMFVKSDLLAPLLNLMDFRVHGKI